MTCPFFLSAQTQKNAWTWFHRKQFNEAEQEINKLKKEVSCAKTNLPLFTQLVFSWNSLRPEQGHFTFYAQVRNAQTKKWSKWHKMMCWGKEIQKSFKSTPDRMSSYQHVRLESVSDMMADAFAIKIEAHNNADLSLVKSCAVNLCNYNLFKAENEMVMKQVKSVCIKGVPCFSQFELKHARNDGLVFTNVMCYVNQLLVILPCRSDRFCRKIT